MSFVSSFVPVYAYFANDTHCLFYANVSGFIYGVRYASNITNIR